MTAAVIARKYRIGIEEMDAEHAVWIELIEKFRATATDHIADQEGIDAARTALEELLAYTRNHFASEERFIAAHHYPGLEAHKRHHREIEAAVLALLDEIRQARPTTPLKLNLFITVWLLEHIMQADWDYAQHIKHHRVAA